MNMDYSNMRETLITSKRDGIYRFPSHAPQTIMVIDHFEANTNKMKI